MDKPHRMFPPPSRGKRGVALLLVLSAIVFIALLVGAFLLSVNFETATSSSAGSNAQTQNLAADVTQVIISQLRDATSGGQTVGWASQPGMVRTFDNAAGNPLYCYKLYSSDQMVVNGPQYQADLVNPSSPGDDITDIPPTGWDTTYAGVYTDLNAPVQDSTGALNYPIVDPAAYTSTPYVQGFAVNGAPLGQSTSTFQNTVPMPVKWLYVRQNGYITAALDSSANGKTVTVPQDPNWAATPANPTNPLVGRMAFWADDETCKVNVNTAGEGLFWDTPRAASNTSGTTTAVQADSGNPENNEYFYSWYQPALHEFQRYPAQPAGVALSPILGTGFQALIGGGAGAFTPTPRLVPAAGSAGGTKTFAGVGTVNYANATRKALYDSLDEYFFNDLNYSSPKRALTDTGGATITKARLEATKFFLTAQSRAPEVNLFNLPRIACWPIDQNVANSPGGGSPYGSGYDQLIAYCSSLSTGNTATTAGTPQPYYFQRSAANDGSEIDYDNTIARNLTLYSYLQYLTGLPVPGFGGQSLATKYGPDNNQILTEIEDYIRCVDLNDLNIPGYQYIGTTPTVNTNQGVLNRQFVKPLYNATTNTMGFGRNFTLQGVSLVVICCGDAQVQPGGAVVAGTTATGNPNNWDGNNTANQALAGLAVDNTGYPSALPTPILKTGKPLAAYEKRYQAGIFFQLQCTSPGNTYPNADLFLQCSGQSGIAFTGAVNGPFPGHTADPNPFYDANYVMLATAAGGNGAGYEAPGALTEPRTLFAITNNVLPTGLWTYPYSQPAANQSNAYYFISRPFTMPATVSGTAVGPSARTIPLTGAVLTINIYQAHGQTVANAPALTTSSPYFIQQIKVKIPSTTIPAPTLDVSAPYTSTGPGTSPTDSLTNANNWTFANRLPNVDSAPPSSYGTSARNVLYNPNDVVRGISLGHGDTRLVAATRMLNDSAGTIFVPRTDGTWNYNSNTTQGSSYFPAGASPDNWTSGTLINPSSVSGAFGANVPASTDTASPYIANSQNPYTSRDWDNPFGNNANQGAFINKPDEGDTNIGGAFGYLPYFNAGNGVSGLNVLPNFYTPNRIMPSPGMFGSLSTGVISQKPWQTLLFRPQVGHPEAAYNSSGARITTQWPPDHLYMDLFWMPTVEPYAISEAFSTGGKINMNYQIVPFTYITRNTALKCLIQGGLSTAANSTGLYTGEKLFSVPNADAVQSSAAYYKLLPTQGSTAGMPSFRNAIDCGTMTATAQGVDPVGELARTFAQFKKRFNGGDIFRSPSEICDIYLTPLGQPSFPGGSWASSPTAETYWNNHLGTADNDRERPYADLYGRLTTKSNTFLVHMRVQSIKQTPNEIASNPTQWTESTDVVTGEYRGSALVERYIDPTDSRMVDYATTALGGSGTLDDLYKYRIVYNKQFAP